MSADRDPIEELLASINDGQRVDWDTAENGLGPGHLPRFSALREVARIADFNRALQREPEFSAAPERWGDMILLERLGQGAHAQVYRAWDPTLQREVALKLLRPEREGTSLLDEGRAAARIRHPHVVTIHGIDRRDGRVGLWMELVRGVTLEQEVRLHGALDAAGARRLGIEIGSALQATHAASVLHRDVKPANVVRDAEERHVLADFGLGTRWDENAARAAGPSGTPMYMAPELLSGSPASERSDVYALGMVLWFAVAGGHPFAVETVDALIAAAGHGPRPLREVRPEIPAALAAIIERAISPDPRARFGSAREMVETLEAWRPDAARPSRPTPVLAFAVLAALVGLAAFAFWRARQAPHALPAAVAPPPVVVPTEGYAVEASFLRRDSNGATPLVTGDRVKPGDRLSLEVRTTRPAWFYVLDEDDRGERFLLFPQPRFDVQNPLPADSTFVLPGTVGGKENAWTVTSAGGREHFLLVASPEPVPEIEADLVRLPAAQPGRPIEYATVGEAAMERLRGVGGVAELPASTPRTESRSRVFDRFKSLAGRENGIRGVWVRQIVLENPR
jgi:eukaryotic-like serine/threonine-protein kinase